MTRVLSTLLGAREPWFSIALQRLERAAGSPSHDVRLTAEVIQRARTKLQELGLDPNDTTAPELYRALEQRVGRDDTLVRAALHVPDDASAADVSASVAQYVEHHVPVAYSSFALKPSVAKRLLKKQPPKRTMKQLNYRSVDSLLKHELVQHVYVAAFFCESAAWRKKLFEQYAKLRPSDFETRSVEISMPQSARWDALARQATSAQRHNIFVVKELGAVVLLPLPAVVPGMALTTLVLTLNALNDVMSVGSFLKLHQVKSDFGNTVKDVAMGEPVTAAQLDNQPVPWRVVHQFYARHIQNAIPSVFEPHVTKTDMQWHHPEALLAQLHPGLSFWQDTRYSGYLHDGVAVSLNVVDAAINYCNHAAFADRATNFLQQYLWQECMLRYLHHENIERALVGEFAPALAYEQATDAMVPQAHEFDDV